MPSDVSLLYYITLLLAAMRYDADTLFFYVYLLIDDITRYAMPALRHDAAAAALIYADALC